MNLIIQDLIRILGAQLILGHPKTQVHRASVDSRRVKPNDLFFALAGEKQDGHDFAMNACDYKAGGVVVSRLDWLKNTENFTTTVLRVPNPNIALRKLAEHLRQGFRGPVVGITGSNGKTTTKQMLSSILRMTAPGLSTAGNYNSQIGLPLVLSELESGHKWMVLEMGASEPGNISSLAEMAQPTIAVITSIGPAHLQTFGSLQKIAQSKWEIMESLPATGAGIVPWNEPLLQPHIRAFKRNLVFFGDDTSCPIRASSIDTSANVSFTLHVGSQSARVKLPVSGRFNVNNALAAAGAAWVQNIPIETIAKGLESFEPAKMRMQISEHASGALIVNDAYNANPASMIQSIRSILETYPQKRRVAVIGTMKELGPESGAMHFSLGTELGRFALDQVFVLGPDTDRIVEGAVAAGAPAHRFVQVQTHDELKNKLTGYLRNDVLIFFKGSRSMKLETVAEAL